MKTIFITSHYLPRKEWVAVMSIFISIYHRTNRLESFIYLFIFVNS